MPRGEELFDSDFLSELEDLTAGAARLEAPPAAAEAERDLHAFLAPLPGSRVPLTEEAFVVLPAAVLGQRTETLIKVACLSPERDAAEAAQSFVVFFQTLLPALPAESAAQVRRLFFRLVPTLLHVSRTGFAGARQEGRRALGDLEKVLLEVGSVRLSPSETELVTRSIDQLASFLAAGEYAMASDVVSSQLLEVLERNRVARALYRLMHVEANLQLYLKERLGYLTPQLRIPEDFPALAEYGPLRVLLEPRRPGAAHAVIQVQLPDIPMPRHVVLQLVDRSSGRAHDLRLDLTGSAEMSLTPGTYALGLLYKPPSGRARA